MYNYIKGKITEKENNLVVVETAGVGYELLVSNNTISELPPVGHDAIIYTYLHVREDAMLLYGFATLAEKQMFLNLITVSGIGPKMATGILSNIPLYDLALAIVSENASALCEVKGIGKKTAERIVLELKEKLTSVSDYDKSVSVNAEFDDAILALTTLGIPRADAVKKVRELFKPDDKAEQIIAKVLKSMS